MPIQDDQAARVMAQASQADAGESGDSADDLRSILKLIASQVQDADRRQTEVLGDMHRRLAQMGDDARMTSARVPDAFAPAFERIQDGIELLARIVAAAEAPPANAELELSAARNAQAHREPDNGDMHVEGAGHDVLASVSSIFPSQEPTAPSPAAGPVDFADTREDGPGDADMMITDEDGPGDADMLITDNAADRADLEGPSEFSNHQAVSQVALPRENLDNQEDRDFEFHDHYEPPVFANAGFVEEHRSRSGEDWDEVSTWNQDEAEALAQVYEAHDEEDAARAAGLSYEHVAQADMLAQPAATFDEPADEGFSPVDETIDGKEYAEMLPQENQSRDFHEVGSTNIAPGIEQAWLEDRFAEIAAKIEESILELRDDQTLHSLSDRFGEFEERIGLALEDVATRHDVDALKSAEAQIDSMVGYFERIEAHLGRVDSLEAQMEALIERFSDDNLAQFVQSQASSQDVDYSELAEAAAENVAQRFLREFAGGALGAEGDKDAISDMRDALQAFANERRERDEESANMLDTIQQALLRVLDRVEELEQAYESAPMASPLDEGKPDTDAPHSKEAVPHAYDDEPLDFDAPAFDEPPVERRRPQQDYQQVRLEYPAAVRSEPAQTKPRPAPRQVDMDLEFDGLQHHQDVATFDQDGVGDTPGQPPAEEPFYTEPPSAEQSASQSFQGEQAGEAQPAPLQRAEVDTSQVSSTGPIDRLRQEFIADARRARERVNQQAALEAAQPEEPEQAKKRFSLPDLSSLTAKVRGSNKPEAPAATPAPAPSAPPATAPAGPMSMSRATLAARAQVAAEEDPTPGRSRFAVPRSRLLVGAAIVLFATAGLLLIMRSPSKPIADTAPPAIGQSLEQIPTGPELTGPEIGAPEINGNVAPDRRSRLDEGRIYDGKFNYDGPGEGGARPMDQALAGLTVTDLDKVPNPAAYSKARHQQRVAKMSTDLGAAAAYTVPANLIEEQPAVNSATAPGSSVARSGDGNHLDLPPASVGPLSLRLAAAKGDPSAQFEVAARLAGGTGTKQDLEGAVKWYQLAASQGFAQAQYRLGTLYERGLGVDKDTARASVWYERAASKGNVKAMHNLAVVSAGRKQGGPDYKTAAKWFEAAAQYGLSDSQFNMAVLYENGLGVDADVTRAYVYYSLAAGNGDTQAKTRRDAVRAMLSNSGLEAAERQVQGFRPKTADRLVNDARVAGEDWKKRADGGY